MGSVENRDFTDACAPWSPMALGAGCAMRPAGLRMLTLGEEAAQMSGLPMARLRVAAVAGSALLAGAGRGGRGDRFRRPGRAASGAGRRQATIRASSCGPRPWRGRCCWSPPTWPLA
jgi:hypothetical protein